MSNHKEKIRYVGIDSLRGWLIVLVMLGHLVLGSVHENIIRYSIYAFHMPLFIGLTGYLINVDSLRASSFFATLARYWWRVLLPFAFAYLFFTGILAIHAFEEGRISAKLLLSFVVTPYYHLWFIPTLVLWVLAFAALLKLRISSVYALVFFLALSLIWASFDSTEQWAVLAPVLSKKVIYFFSFFLFGAWLRTAGSRKLRTLFSQFKILPMVAITACAGLYLINIGADKSLLKACVWLILNLALITLLIDSAISKPSAKNSIISRIGRNSLPIYLWHAVPMFILKGFDIHQTYPLVYYFVASISMVLIVLAVLRLERGKAGRNKLIDRCLFGAV
ncbi:MAG: acyltransferase [Arenicella sp.]|nr:acyltransferase [Arenicella sp.]